MFSNITNKKIIIIQPSINCILLETTTIGLFGFLLSRIIVVAVFAFHDQHTNKRKQQRWASETWKSSTTGIFPRCCCYFCFCFPFTDKSGNSTLTHPTTMGAEEEEAKPYAEYSHPPHWNSFPSVFLLSHFFRWGCGSVDGSVIYDVERYASSIRGQIFLSVWQQSHYQRDVICIYVYATSWLLKTLLVGGDKNSDRHWCRRLSPLWRTRRRPAPLATTEKTFLPSPARSFFRHN